MKVNKTYKRKSLISHKSDIKKHFKAEFSIKILSNHNIKYTLALQWLHHVYRTDNTMSKTYTPRRHRRHGQYLKQLLDGAETGLQRPNS